MEESKPPSLTWRYDERGVGLRLHYGSFIVGSAWTPSRPDMGWKGAAWMAGNRDLGIADSGSNPVASLDEAKDACRFWVDTELRRLSLLRG